MHVQSQQCNQSLSQNGLELKYCVESPELALSWSSCKEILTHLPKSFCFVYLDAGNHTRAKARTVLCLYE